MKDEKEYLYIMDYSDCTISRLDVTEEEDDDIERVLNKHGFKIDTCAYMYSKQFIDTIPDADDSI